MDKFEIGKRLMRCFPNSFINAQGEFVADRKTNQYFRLDDCETEEDVACKVLAWFSRAAYKSEPYSTKKANDKLHKFMLDGINKYLGTAFTEENMELIYTYLGNDCNRPLCREFIRSSYVFDLLYDYAEKGRGRLYE